MVVSTELTNNNGILDILNNRVDSLSLLFTTELTVICRGKPQSLTKCCAEFTEYYRGKLIRTC